MHRCTLNICTRNARTRYTRHTCECHTWMSLTHMLNTHTRYLYIIHDVHTTYTFTRSTKYLKIHTCTYLETHIKALTRRIRNYTSARTCMHAHTTYIHTAHTTYIHTAHTTYTHTAHNTIHNSYSWSLTYIDINYRLIQQAD